MLPTSQAGCSTPFRPQGVSETWKYRVTDELSRGLVVLWTFTTQASQSHQLFKWPAAFQSQHLNHSLLLYWPKQPPSETYRRHPSYCYVVPFSLSARKMNGTGEWWFVVCGNRYFGAPKAHEKHLTKEGTDSKNTRRCLRDIEILSWKLKQSLALLTDYHQATARRLL